MLPANPVLSGDLDKTPDSQVARVAAAAEKSCRNPPILQRESDGSVAHTTLDLAAFMYMQGLELLRAEKVTHRRYRFVFRETHPGQAEEMTLAYVNGECSRFGAAVAMIKSMINGFSGGKPRESRDARSSRR